jgi:hypothetical protein
MIQLQPINKVEVVVEAVLQDQTGVLVVVVVPAYRLTSQV